MSEKSKTIDLVGEVENIPSLREKFKGSAFIDLRETTQVSLAHLLDCGQIPFKQLSQRVSELPNKMIALVVVGDSATLPQGCEFLISRKYTIVGCLITDNMNPQSWQKLIGGGFAKKGSVEYSLWSANQFLIDHIQKIEEKKTVKSCRVLDIGCGSGREAIYLAKRGWEVTAIDNQSEAIRRVKNLAFFNQVRVDVQQKNIMEDNFSFEKNTFDLIIMFRFLHRPLFDKIKNWLKPGGYLLVETFSIEAAKFGKPKRKSLLLIPGELAEYFSDWEISKEYQRNLADGRPLIGCIIRKPDSGLY